MKNLMKILLPLAVILVAGCAGTPDPEPEPERVQEEQPERAPVPLPTQERDDAARLRGIVERNGFGPEVPEEYAAAETAFTAAEAAYENDPERARSLYLEAEAGYRSVINQGSRLAYERVRAEVNEQREEALSIRADVAEKEQFEQADRDLEEAERLFAEEDFVESFGAFDQSREGFALAYQGAIERRERARRSLQELDENLEDSTRRIQTMQDDLEDDDE